MSFYEHPYLSSFYKRPWQIKKEWWSRNGVFVKLARYGAGGIFIASLVLINILLLKGASAVYTYNAVDNLGQTDGSHTNPNYTTSNLNNTLVPNPTGMGGPDGMAMDTVNHHLFVADAQNDRIMVFDLDASNHISSHTAAQVIGQTDLNTDDACSSTTRNLLCGPDGIYYDSPSQLLFVADGSNNRVLVYDLSGGITDGMNASHVLGQPDFTSSSSVASQSGMSDPNDVIFDDASSTLFVADYGNNRVLTYDLSGGITDGMNASHVLGQADFTHNSIATTQNGMRTPEAVSYDAADKLLFVAEAFNNRITVFNLSSGITDGMNASHVIGQINFTSNAQAETQSGLDNPSGINYDAVDKFLFVSDLFNQRALVYNLSAGVNDGMNASHVIGQINFTTGDCTGTQNLICNPSAAYYEPSTKQLFVGDGWNSRVMDFDLSGGISDGMNASDELGQIDYQGNVNYSLSQSDNANPNPYGFGSTNDFGQAVIEDPVHHRMFVTDNGNQRVLIYNLNANNQLTSHAASFELGHPDFSGGFGSDPCNTASSICDPMGVEVDTANDRLFVTDGYDQARVLVFDLSGGISNGMAASFVLGQPDMTTVNDNCSGFGTVAANTFCDPISSAYDSNHDILYVAEEGGSRVLSFDANPATITNGENATHVLGQTDFTSEDCVPSNEVNASGMCSPENVYYDDADNYLFVTQDDFDRIVVYDMSGGISDDMDASWAIGEPNLTTDNFDCYFNHRASASSLCEPYGRPTYDPVTKRLFVPDTNDDRILEYDLSGGISSGMNAQYVIGTADSQDFSSDGVGDYGGLAEGVYTQNSVPAPDGLYYDATNNKLYAGDFNNDRLMVFDVGPVITNDKLPNGQVSVPYSTTITSQDNIGPPTYSITGGALPPGLSLNSSTGDITGTPTQVGTFNFTVQDTDSIGEIGAKALSITIGYSYLASDELGQLNSGGNIDFNAGNPDQTLQGANTSAITIDKVNHRMFVADTNHNRVLVYSLDSQYHPTSKFANFVLGQSDFNSSSAALTSTGMDIPYGLFYDNVNQWLFVSDNQNNRVLVYDLSGGISDGMAAAHVLGEPDFTTNNPFSTSASTLDDPRGLYYDAANKRLFISDHSTARVLIYDLSSGISDGMAAVHVLGQTTFTSSSSGTTNTTMNSPAGLTYDPSSSMLFIGDEGNHRLLVFDLSGGITDGMAAVHVLGEPDFTTVDPCTPQTQPITAEQICFAEGIAYDAARQRLYVGDIDYDRVLEFDLSGGITDDMAAAHVLGQSDLTANTFQGVGPGNRFAPVNIFFDDANSDLYLSNQGGGGSVFLFDLSGAISDGMAPLSEMGLPDATSLSEPTGTVIDTVHHRLFVDDYGNSRVLVYNLDSSNNLLDHTADFVLGQPNFTADGNSLGCTFENAVPSATNMCEPSGIAYDPNHDRLFVPDQNDSRVLVYDLSGGISSGMAASWVLGQPDFSTTDCNTTQDGMCDPFGGAAYDTTTDFLYVGDSDNGRVLVYDLSGSISNGLNATFVLGEPDFTTVNSPNVTQNGLEFPEGIALDSTNHRLFVADWEDAGRVMVFDTSSLSNGMNASAELGETDFTSSNSASDNNDPPDDKSFGPEGLAYDSKHNLLFVEDGNDDRVLIFDVNGIANDESAVGLLGQPTFDGNDTSCTPSQSRLCPEGGLNDYYDTANNRYYLSDGNNRIMIYDFNMLVTPASDGTVGSAYSFNTNSQTQGTTAYSLTSGSLPNGLGLDSSTGVISGTPTTPGLFNFAVHASDNNGPAGTFLDDANYSINIPNGGGDTTAPSVPTGLQITGHTGSSLSLSWNASTDDTAVTGYHVFRDGVQVGSPAGTTFNDTGLSPSTTYNYTVSAFDAASNESAQSSPAVPGTTDAPPDNTPPSTPTNLQVTNTTSSSITISWDPSTDNVGVANYNIFRDGGVTPIAVVNGTGFTDIGLNPSTTYTYTVSAVDTSNNESPQSTPVQGTTDANTNNNGGGGNNGGGNQGGGSQSSSGGGSGGTGSGGSSPPAPVPINLDNLPPATSVDACTGVTSASAGQVFSFTSTDGTQHKVTVLQVGADSIEVKIDNLPKTLFVGQLVSQDVTGDNTPDICVDVLSITDGVAKLDIAKIIFAIAPGGSTVNNGIGAGANGGSGNGNSTVKAAPSFLTNVLRHIPKALLLAFPWLLFILLAASVARLVFLSVQERRYAAKINTQLAKEKVLSEQKNNFISLSSHYLRTPVTTISTGIELASSLSPDISSKESLKTLSLSLNQGVNDLLAQAEHKAPSEMKAPEAGEVISRQGSVSGLGSVVPSSAGGYVQLNSLRAITFATLASFGLVGLADYILTHVDLYNVGLISILTQLAGLGLLGVMLVASLRSYHNRRDVRLSAEKLLANQRELDTARSTLIKNSLDSLKGPLAELKQKLTAAASAPGANPTVMKPALDGIAQLEGLLSKFVIASSLTGGSMSRASQRTNTFDLVNDTVKRYSSAIQSKQLNIDNRVFPAEVVQDPLLLSFVVDSLLNNAIKYSPANGEITIEGKKKGSSVELSVADHGPGIPENKQQELFEPFGRVENAATDFNTQGAGLSLYLDKLVVEYLGGEISLKSTASGTTVSFSVPA